MVDIVSKKVRSRMMSGIRGRDTKPELAIRKALFAAGYRYRLNAKSLPGKPDIVLARYRCAIFVHGCFWHRHMGCKFAYTPKSNVQFWQDKFVSNVRRDRLANSALHKAGWRVLVVWECQVNEGRVKRLLKAIEPRPR